MKSSQDIAHAALDRAAATSAVEVPLTPGPTPQAIRAARLQAVCSPAQAGALVHASARAWLAWETGLVPMHAGLWELFERKVAQR